MRRSLLFAAALSLAACASMIPQPIRVDVEWLAARGERVELSQLMEGRTAYVARCAGCHNLHSPGELDPEQWARTVIDMERQEGLSLSTAERAAIVAYLTATSARLRALSD